MKGITVILLVLAASCLGLVEGKEGRNGGTNCGICSAAVAIIEQLVEFRNSSVVNTLDNLCDLFPQPIHSSCKEALSYLGPSLLKLLVHNNGPDVVCHALNVCYTDKGAPTCKSITPPLESSKLPFEVKVARAKRLIKKELKELPNPLVICDIPGIKYLCELVNRSLSDKTPLVDFDSDGFSPSMTFRGSAWRGKDCMDFVSRMHPGAIPIDRDLYQDSNCNGIFGINNVTHQSYEDELCSLSQPRGVATLGDSISAHFSFPPVWLDPTKINVESFKNLALVLENESDWPMLGSFTGHGSNDWKDVIQGPIDSIYNRMVDRNRCNHRDYQNIAINGEDSFNVHDVMKTLSRDQTFDRPVMLFIVLVGNDVCQGKSQDLNKMTTQDEMYTNTLETLEYLDKRLPAGSFVSIIGLADGRILYESMSKRIHPIANFWGDFTYGDFYEYLNCMKISPCPAWLNSNETARNIAAKRVEDLNKVLKDISTKRKNFYSNYQLNFLEDPMASVLKDWASEGGQPWQLVEQADGFHSNQMGQALTAKAIWEELESTVPEALGPVNPYNQQIKKIFGDQGGL